MQRNYLEKDINFFLTKRDLGLLNNKKKRKIFSKKIKFIRKKFFTLLSKKLNQINKINLNKQCWKILLEPWLTFYLESMYFRWVVANKLLKKKIKVIYFNKIKDISIFDNNEFLRQIGSSDIFNQYLNQKILKYLSSKKNIKIKIRKKTLNFKKNFYKENLFKIFNYKLIDLIISNIFGKQKYFINLNLEKWVYLKLCLKLKNIPLKGLHWFNNNQIYNFYKLNDNTNNNKIRQKLNFKSINNNTFESFISNNIFHDIPEIYVEKFSLIMDYVKKIPIKPKFILCDHQITDNTIFKFWSALNVYKKTKLLISDHGGVIGNGLRSIQFEKISSNYKIHWSVFKKKNETSLPAIHLNSFKNMRKYTTDNLLFISHDAPKYPIYFNTGPIQSQWKYQLDMFNKFYKQIHSTIQSKIKIKPYYLNGWNWWLYPHFKNYYKDKLISSKEYANYFKSSKIIIVNYPKTAFLQALISGPTILLYHANTYQDLPIVEEQIKKLKQAKIYFDNPIQASKHLNNVYSDVYKWWDSRKVKKIRNQFIKNFLSFSNKNEINEWINFLKKIN